MIWKSADLIYFCTPTLVSNFLMVQLIVDFQLLPCLVSHTETPRVIGSSVFYQYIHGNICILLQ